MTAKFEMDNGGRPLIVEIGRYAGQANGAALVRYGDTVVLVSATMSDEPREGIDFFPLLVDYEERMYSVGKIPGGWGRREGKPTEAAILASRMIDRPLRPLFPDGFRNDVHIVALVLSVDLDNKPDITALVGASVALTISDIPFHGPIGAVKIGRVDGELIVNPTLAEAEKSDIDLTVAGTKDAILMVEAGCDEVQEEDILDAIEFAHEQIKKQVAFQESLPVEVKKPKMEAPLYNIDSDLEARVRTFATSDLRNAIITVDKSEREGLINQVKDKTVEYFIENARIPMDDEESMADPREDLLLLEKSVGKILDNITKEEVRQMIVEEGLRPDGRGLNEIRRISCDVGLLPRAHGSGLFTRGQTQVLTVTTLGGVDDEQILDGVTEESSKRYIHHYNFPAYSVGEVRPLRGPGRREIGHGALAERALLPVLPSKEDFPYTMRLVSEVLESNGSTSQASICGSTLSLMDAGVPIKKPVAGIAMGLVKEGDKVAILSDIQGLEDALGDMDFKVAGTRDGITALQMDIKVEGISKEILRRALAQAHQGRLFILNKMAEAIEAPRPKLSKYAPRIITMEIDTEKIRDVIGPGGKVIRGIIEKTGVDINIEDDGRVFILSIDEESGERAVNMIEQLTKEVEVGEVYMGKVVRTTGFGAFVEILPGKEGLVHISKLDKGRVAKVEDVVKPGDEVLVKVIEIDRQGRINLSRRDVLEDE
jgi:polyribonucleotide nucleotidyltransferase